MPPFLAMFPGQGSQSPEMSKELLKQFPEVRLLFEEAEAVSGLPLLKVCTQEGEYQKLQQTLYQQPSILTHSYAIWSLIQDRLDLVPSFFAGHSLGEYTALVAASKISFSEAISLVCERAQAMQESVLPGLGGMLAVRTRDSELLSKLCFEAKENYGGVLEIVNYNSPEQYILSGHKDAIQNFASILKENKILARPLDVSGPFHSSLMSNARERMTPLLNRTHFDENHNYVISNLTGEPAHPYESRFLIGQIDHPVLWLDTLRYAHSQGVRTYVEFGPGKVLASLVNKSLPKGQKIFDTSNPSSALRSLEVEFPRMEAPENLRGAKRFPSSKPISDRS